MRVTKKMEKVIITNKAGVIQDVYTRKSDGSWMREGYINHYYLRSDVQNAVTANKKKYGHKAHAV